MTEVVGYIFQAAGILAVSILIKKNSVNAINGKHFAAVIILDAVFIVLSATANNLVSALVLGYIMNLLHGAVAAYYLFMLATKLEWNMRALSFGIGYGIASIASWLISKIGTGNFLTTNYALIIYVLLAVFTILLIHFCKDATTYQDNTHLITKQAIKPSTISIAIITILLLTVSRGIGFYFPSADLSSGINLEFSRAFYAVGLILAGIICDRKRSYGAILSVTALICPFIMIALSGEVGSSIIFWIIGYILFGFLNVYRIVVFSDIATSNNKLLWMAAFGLLFGRLGDACGNFIGIYFTDNKILLVSLTSVLFVISTILFFMLYNGLYMNVTDVNDNEDDKLFSFMKTYDISTREADVLKLIISGLSNSEISSNLYISENTVKFHIRNILKKTGCANRKEMLMLYRG